MAFTLSTFLKLAGAAAIRAHLQARVVALAERVELEARDAVVARLFREAWPALAGSEVRGLSQDFDRADAFAGDDAQAVLRVGCCQRRGGFPCQAQRQVNYANLIWICLPRPLKKAWIGV